MELSRLNMPPSLRSLAESKHSPRSRIRGFRLKGQAYTFRFTMGWFKRKMRQSGPGSNNRYVGKPLLIVLDNYVLSTLGQLSLEKETESLSILQQLYGSRDSNWRTILRTRFQISDSMDETVRQMWASDQERAEREGITLAVEDFARMVVNQNFAHLIEEK